MKTMRSHYRVPALIVCCALCLGITSIDSTFKYSWGENIGWLNWRDANGGAQGVEYLGNHLAGYIWAENVGFINVGNGGGPYTNTNDTNYGVNILGGGNLAGYAWGENIGWINFDTAAALGGAGQQARYDAGAGRFRGYAWGENVGWINLDDPTQYVGVVAPVTITQWRSVRTHAGPPSSELGIVLNASASDNGTSGPTVDSRGPTISYPGIQKIQVDFNGPVTLANTANVSVNYRVTTPGSPATMGGPITAVPSSVTLADADTMDIVFPANTFPNMICIEIIIGAGTLAETIVGDADCSVRGLVGDTNGSGNVTTTDQLATRAQVGQPIAAAPRYDINMSGSTITTTDQLAIKTQVVSPIRTALCP